MMARKRVLALVGLLPDATPIARSDGATGWVAGCHEFLRLASDADIARLWTGDMGLGAMLRARPRVFPVVDEHRFRISFEVAPGRIDAREFAELLLDSCAIRCGIRRAQAVDEAAFVV